MTVLGLLQETLISRGAVGGTRGSCHVGGVSLGLALSGFDSHFSPLIEAQAGKYNDLVVEERAEDKKNEAWDSLPLELFETEGDTACPDKHRSTRVDCGTLRGGCKLSGCDAAHVEEGD